MFQHVAHRNCGLSFYIFFPSNLFKSIVFQNYRISYPIQTGHNAQWLHVIAASRMDNAARQNTAIKINQNQNRG